MAFLFLLLLYLWPYIAVWHILQQKWLLCALRHPNSRGLGQHMEKSISQRPCTDCGARAGGGPKDTQVNVAIYWGSAGVASCLQLGNPAFLCL